MADPFASLDDAPVALRVNAAFASRLSKSGELAVMQRRRAKLAGASVPEAALRAASKSLREALAFERQKLLRRKRAADGAADAARIAAFLDAMSALPQSVALTAVSQRAGIALDAAARAGGGSAAWAAVTASLQSRCIERLLRNKHAVEACTILVRAARRAVYGPAGAAATGSSAAAPVPPPPPRRRRDDALGEAGGASSQPPVLADADAAQRAAKRPRRAVADDAAFADGAGAPERRAGGGEADRCALEGAPSSGAAGAPRGALRSIAATALALIKPHGRGAGRGRGLHPVTGEPAYDDMHPSWQAKRRLRAKASKAVHKDLAKMHRSSAALAAAAESVRLAS